jgi:HD superfamily phosphohydrolase
MKDVLHRDQIHSDVRFDPLAVALLDTPSLQRLGRIYQLGYAHYVYRGGTHTRLSHVMGAYHVAGLLVQALRENYESAQKAPVGAVEPASFLPTGGSKSLPIELRWDILLHLVRWAALLHDIGHIPVGHTLEDEFAGIYTKHDDFASPRLSYLWFETAPGRDADIREAFRLAHLYPPSFDTAGISLDRVWETVLLICLHRETTEKTFRQLLAAGQGFAPTVLRALENNQGTLFFPYMSDIVSNTICADYLDYLQRDPTNLGLDVLSFKRVISRFWVGRGPRSELHMALSLVDRRGKPRLDTTTAVVDLVRQRFRFAESVYYHKTKVSASAMLAKVFNLLGKPEEIPPPDRDHLTANKIEGIVADVFRHKVAARGSAIQNLKKVLLPSALLDAEIGDESLHLFLFYKAWDQFEDAASKDDRAHAARALRAIALLQAIARRKFYKVCFVLNKQVFRDLSSGSHEDEEIERQIKDRVLDLRSDSVKRAEIEARMSKEAELLTASPPIHDPFILYIPPRKSQAKGIETRAIDRGELVTLGKHSVVSGEVGELNKKYQELWKMLVFVHPNFEKDVLKLSRAVDAVVLEFFPELDIYDERVIATLKEAAWFDYVRVESRVAAERYSAITADREPNWSNFDRARQTAVGGLVDDEYAYRATLLDCFQSLDNTRDGLPEIRQRFSAPGSLKERMDQILEGAGVESFNGVASEMRDRYALEAIAKEIVTAPPQLPLG